MRMLFVCFIVVLFISGKSAATAEQEDNIEASGKKESANNTDKVMQVKQSLPIEQVKTEGEGDVKVRRSLESDYAPPCAPCGYSNQYAQPSVVYNAPPIAYTPPSYGGYPAPSGYGQPQRRPKYGGRRGIYGNAYVKQAPVYQAPHQSYQPSYQSPQPSYQPSYQPQQTSYQPPQPSYQPPQASYQPPQASYQRPQSSYQPAPIYSASSYGAPAPSYSQPIYGSPSYSKQAYSAPAHPVSANSYSYPSPAPSVQCASNLLVGCQPHVSEVPCSGYPSSYGSPAYGSQPQYSEPAYRSNSQDDTPAVSSQQDPTKPNKEMKQEKSSILDNIPSNKKGTENSVSSALTGSNASEKGSTSENNNQSSDSQQKDSKVSGSDQQALSPEEAKQKQQDLMAKMAEFAAKAFTNDQSRKQSTGINDQGKQQQNNLPSANVNSENGKQNMTPLPVPPPTSTNVGMIPASSQQINTQYHPQNQFVYPGQQQWT